MRGVPSSSFVPIPSILIVDGDDDTRLLYRTVLAPVATVILEAGDGATALAAAVDRQPDVVITEIRLRRLDGFTLCELLRANPLTRHCFRFVVTADGLAAGRAAQSGADRVLIKPCTPEDLITTITEMWGEGHRSSRSGSESPYDSSGLSLMAAKRGVCNG